MPDIEDFYSQDQRDVQKSTGSLKLANAVYKAIVWDEIPEDQHDFIAGREYFFLSTVSEDGQPQASYKGGKPGLVRIANPRQLAFPSYDGNGMFFSMGNIKSTAKVGLLFMDMETPHRVRMTGLASLSTDPNDMALWPGCNMVVRVDITSVFLNCARYIHPHQRIGTSRHVPDEQGNQVLASWKRIDELQGNLHERDEGRADEAGGILTTAEYDALVHKGIS